MEAIECILSRRSIREYKPGDITPDQINTLLKAAMAAPSAGNQQPWHFVVVTDREKLDQLGEINPYAKMARQAPLGIMVCGELALQKYPGYWVQDCSAAIENILLAAHGMGLGGVWTGIYPVEHRVESYLKLFKLPEGIVPLAFLVFGHPGEDKPPSDRYNPERVHYEQW